jgi:hypothetical protein
MIGSPNPFRPRTMAIVGVHVELCLEAVQIAERDTPLPGLPSRNRRPCHGLRYLFVRDNAAG